MLISQCQIGSKVIIARAVPGVWVPSMNKTIGIRGVITEILSDGSGVQVSLPGDEFGWAYSAESLEPVEQDLGIDPRERCGRSRFESKHGTTERWDVCDYEDCRRTRPYPRNCTLNLEEVSDAGADGVDIHAVEMETIVSGGFKRRSGRWWFDGRISLNGGEPFEAIDYEVNQAGSAALDRVVDHWARVAEMDKIAAQVAEHLKAARGAAERHVAAFAESIDHLSIEAAEPRRDMVIGLRAYLRDFDRLLRVYERQADGSKP